jgi:hypothetical protein
MVLEVDMGREGKRTVERERERERGRREEWGKIVGF